MDVSSVIRLVLGACTGRGPVPHRLAGALRALPSLQVPFRTPVMLVLWIMVSGQASAQPSPVVPATDSEAVGECLSVSPTGQVVVATSSGQTIRGTLMCLSETGAWLLADGRQSKIPLDEVRRIRTTADPVWDGAVKGAVIPLIFWAVLCHECSAEPMLRSSLTWGLIGLVSDALDSHRKTLYQGGGRSVSVRWGFSF